MKAIAYMVLVTAVFYALCVGGIIGITTTRAEESPLIAKGETVLVIWDCLPITQSEPCYGEMLRATSDARSDGWIEVVDTDDKAWLINPARATSIKRAPKSAKAE